MTGTTGPHTAGHAATLTLPTDTSILVRRPFAAPAHLMYRALTEPRLLRRWWTGGDRVLVVEADLRIGGRWRVVVAGEGYTVGFHGVYREIVPGARVVCTEVVESAPSAEAGAALCTYTFTPAGSGSTVGLWTELPIREDRDALLDSGMAAGLRVKWDLWEQVAAGLR